MSNQDAEKFLDAVDQDGELYQEIEEIHDQVLALAKKQGLDISREEMTRALLHRLVEGIPLKKAGSPDDYGKDSSDGGGGNPSTCFFSEVPGR